MRVALEGYLAAHGETAGCKSIDLAAPCGETSAVADGKEDVSV